MKKSATPSYRRRIFQFSAATTILIFLTVVGFILGIQRSAQRANATSIEVIRGLSCVHDLRSTTLRLELLVARGDLRISDISRAKTSLACPESVFAQIPHGRRDAMAVNTSQTILVDFLRANFSALARNNGALTPKMATGFSTLSSAASTSNFKLQSALLAAASARIAQSQTDDTIAIAMGTGLGIVDIVVLALLAKDTYSHLFRPIDALSNAMREIGEGHLETPITGSGYLETMVIADTAEVMRKHLVDEINAASKRAILETASDEREQLALAMHDGPLQLLAALKLRIDIAKGYELSPALTDTLEKVSSGLVASIDLLRGFIVELDPPSLEDGLRSALEVYFARVKNAVEVEFTLTTIGIEPLPTTSQQLHRAVRVATQNACIHGKANQVEVTIQSFRHGYRLTVVDNGCGFDASVLTAQAIGHIGLFSLRRLLESLGGGIRVSSTSQGRSTSWGSLRHDNATIVPTQGTLVEVFLPQELDPTSHSFSEPSYHEATH